MRRAIAGFLVGLVVGLGTGCWAAWSFEPEYLRLEAALPYYLDLKNSLYRGLADNDFAHAYASKEDLQLLREAFGFLASETTDRAKVLRLIRWIDEETAADEVMSVRAVDLYRAKSGACEIHSLAVGALTAFGLRARWIGGVKSSIGFGYLEVFLEDHWELFRLRSGEEDPSLHQSAWDLYRASEPSLSIRSFWWKPHQSWTSWKGSVYPVLFPFANVVDHPEVEPVLRTDHGISVHYRILNPFDYIYGYFAVADAEWTLEGTLVERFRAHLASEGMGRQREDADFINWLGLSHYED